MSEFQIKTPVVFIVFKRPDTTGRVFDAIRKVKPPKLFLIADGPRVDRPGEAENCADTRAILERVDWDCEVLKNYSEINLGCGKRVTSGLDWAFDMVDEAIILEDDCLPHPTFFRFCEELLERYRHDNRIVAVSGQNVQFGRRRTEYSYYFSLYNHCWGWASWRRAWQYNDFDMKLWSEIKARDFLRDILVDENAVKCWAELFQATYDGYIDTWDNQWTLAAWIQSGLSILPNINLVSNIGFGPESTHTPGKGSKFANIPTEAMEFPLKHPPFMIRNRQADSFTQKILYNKSGFQQLKSKIRKFLKFSKK